MGGGAGQQHFSHELFRYSGSFVKSGGQSDVGQGSGGVLVFLKYKTQITLKSIADHSNSNA